MNYLRKARASTYNLPLSGQRYIHLPNLLCETIIMSINLHFTKNLVVGPKFLCGINILDTLCFAL